MEVGLNGKRKPEIPRMCDPEIVLECSNRMEGIEVRLRKIEQLLLEQGTCLAAMAEAIKIKNAALDRLASRLMLSDGGGIAVVGDVKR